MGDLICLGAIAILKSRKREKYVSNLSRYFVAALQGDWSGLNLVSGDIDNEEIDLGAVFLHWYDLGKQIETEQVAGDEFWFICAKKQKNCLPDELRVGDCWIGMTQAIGSRLI